MTKYLIEEQCFSFREDDAKVETIQKRLQSCLVSIQKEKDTKYCKDLSKHTSLKLLSNLERILFGIRGSNEQENKNRVLTEYPLAYMDIPVSIDIRENHIKITTPLTTVRNMASSYYLASLVLSKMKMYEQENDFAFYEYMAEPFIAIQKRKIPKNISCMKIKDNNNEDAHIINAITIHGFHRSDNVSIMTSFTSCVEYVDDFNEQGMEFIFVKQKNLKDYLDEILACKKE